MSSKVNGQNFKKDSKTKARRVNVISRLEAQLKANTKQDKESKKKTAEYVPLTPGDVSRINKEIDILKSRA